MHVASSSLTTDRFFKCHVKRQLKVDKWTVSEFFEMY